MFVSAYAWDKQIFKEKNFGRNLQIPIEKYIELNNLYIIKEWRIF
jgi:hypothetical protein